MIFIAENATAAFARKHPERATPADASIEQWFVVQAVGDLTIDDTVNHLLDSGRRVVAIPESGHLVECEQYHT